MRKKIIELKQSCKARVKDVRAITNSNPVARHATESILP